MTNKAFDNIRRKGISTALVDALNLRIELLSSCQILKGRVEGSSKLMETLSRGDLTNRNPLLAEPKYFSALSRKYFEKNFLVNQLQHYQQTFSNQNAQPLLN